MIDGNLYIIFERFAISILIGALIGLERQHEVIKILKDKSEGEAGIRTFSFYALLGSISGYLSEFYGNSIILVSFSALTIMIFINYYFDAKNNSAKGITTEISGFLTFFVGLITIHGEILIAVSIAILITFMLSIKTYTEKLSKKITNEDIFATLEFIFLSFVILPILPNQSYGPFKFFNPYQLWLFVVIILGVSFVGYIATKIVGSDKGIGITAILGGLASSTAVTLSFAGRSKDTKELSISFALGIVTASSIMFIRMILILGLIDTTLAIIIAPIMFAMGSSGLLYSYYLYIKSKKESSKKQSVKLKNPFRLSQGLYFALLYSFILLIVDISKHIWGTSGVTIISFISGLPDVDAISISLAKLTHDTISIKTAITGIFLASIANTLTKGGLTLSLATKKTSVYTIIGFVIIIIIGTIAYFYSIHFL